MNNFELECLADKHAFYYHNEVTAKTPNNREFWRAKAAGFNAALIIIMGVSACAIKMRRDGRSIEYVVKIGDYRASVIINR